MYKGTARNQQWRASGPTRWARTDSGHGSSGSGGDDSGGPFIGLLFIGIAIAAGYAVYGLYRGGAWVVNKVRGAFRSEA